MNSSHSQHRHYLGGITELEVIVTITVIAVLSCLAFIISRTHVVVRRDIPTTHKILGILRLKLEDFAVEHNGVYPVGEDWSSAALYRALSGDESGQGQNPTGTIYWNELNDPRNTALVGMRNGGKVILDGYGNVIRYQAALDENRQTIEGIRGNDDFNLWSIGPDGEPSSLQTPGVFESEETKDDIWR
ncbi:hypothetical protein N9Y81_00400 [Akkermansiaceae bacterium]|nr:hypothetical protein [Akkermansiaceae bacterium]